MRVIVNILTEARAELLRVLTARTPTHADALDAARIYLIDITQQFERYGGIPPSAVRHRRSPEGWWWVYADGIWLGFTVEDRRFGSFLAVTRTITLVAVEERPAGN